jgi:hypothetical protein
MNAQRSPLTPRQAGLLSFAARITSLLFDVAPRHSDAAGRSDATPGHATKLRCESVRGAIAREKPTRCARRSRADSRSRS